MPEGSVAAARSSVHRERARESMRTSRESEARAVSERTCCSEILLIAKRRGERLQQPRLQPRVVGGGLLEVRVERVDGVAVAHEGVELMGAKLRDAPRRIIAVRDQLLPCV